MGRGVAPLRPDGEIRAGGSTSPTDRRFTGQIDDTAIGLYFYNARYYDPVLARFISADTVVPEPGNPQSLSRYSYCLGNPVKYTDPSGHAVDAGGDNFGPIEPPPPPWYAPVIIAAAKSLELFDARVGAPLRYYEINRSFIPQVSFRSDPISGDSFHIETYCTTTDISLQISGRIEYGDPDSMIRFDQRRITYKPLKTIEGYVDWTTLQIGAGIKSPPVTARLGDFRLSSRGRFEVAGKPTPPLNYEFGAATSSEVKFAAPLAGRELAVTAYPAITVRNSYHGGPPTSMALLVGVGVLAVAAAAPPEIVIPMVLAPQPY